MKGWLHPGMPGMFVGVKESVGYPQGIIHCFVRSKALRRARDLKDGLYVMKPFWAPRSHIAILSRTLWTRKLKHVFGMA